MNESNDSDQPTRIVVRDLTSLDPIPYELLLDADPSQERVSDYIKSPSSLCRLATIDSECVGVYVLRIDADNANANCAEIINISVAPKHQKKGIGKELISDAFKLARQVGAQTIIVGTGNSSISQLAFYQKCGFRIIAIEFDHFVKNYVEPIEENGIACRDLIRLSFELR
jgi:ribosomal protein S18 acetylase RimI-like enzyme